MGAYVFDNQIFDAWLTKKSEEILSKVDRETISNEDMLILILKAQTNHFHHVDIEFREEFKRIDARFDQMWAFQKWQAGILLAMFGGLYLKLFLG
jgi:hypothetical protein